MSSHHISPVPLYRRSHYPYGFTYWPPASGHELDHFFDNFNQVQLRDHVGRLTLDEESGGFTYQLDASGFHPSELKVLVEGDDVVVSGEHRESNHGGSCCCPLGVVLRTQILFL